MQTNRQEEEVEDMETKTIICFLLHGDNIGIMSFRIFMFLRGLQHKSMKILCTMSDSNVIPNWHTIYWIFFLICTGETIVSHTKYKSYLAYVTTFCWKKWVVLTLRSLNADVLACNFFPYKITTNCTDVANIVCFSVFRYSCSGFFYIIMF